MRTTAFEQPALDAIAYAHAAQDHSVSLEDLLLDYGVSEEALPEVTALIGVEAKREGMKIAAAFVAWLCDVLRHQDQVGAALGKALANDSGESLTALGLRFGVSKQAVSNIVSRIRVAMPTHVAAVVRGQPDKIDRPPGEGWLTAVEAMRCGNCSLEKVRRLHVLSVEHHGRLFYDRADLLAKVEAEEIRQAELEVAKDRARHR